MSVYTHAEAAKRLEAIEALLNSNGVQIKQGSELERLSLNVFDVLEKHQDPSLQDDSIDVSEWLREVLGMNHLIGLLLDVAGHPSFAQLIPHLRLLNDGLPAQNSPSSVLDQASNKLFELLIACSAMRAGFLVELDDPDRSRGDNPDVILTAGDGRTFAVACKALHSVKPQTILDNVEKAVDQILASSADRGVVALNLKNVLHHSRFWSVRNEPSWLAGDAAAEYDAWLSLDALQAEMLASVQTVMGQLSVAPYLDGLRRILGKNGRITPGVLCYVQTAAGWKSPVGPIPVSVGFLNFHLSGEPSVRDQVVLNALNDGLHGA